MVTGGAGFIGSNFVRRVLETEPSSVVVNLDLLTYAGVEATIAELDDHANHRFVRGDIRDVDAIDEVVAGADVIVNFAAESHVDRSIVDPTAFTSTNVVGTGVLLDAARRHEVPTFIQVSTDEVYGSLEKGRAAESDPLHPSSPYSASKAGADLLVQSYGVTYGYDAIITRCTNNYGPYQFPEKVLPVFITRAMTGQTLPVYGSGINQRDWLFVDDHCAAIQLLIDRGTPGLTYNIGADNQITNLDLAQRIVALMGVSDDRIEFVEDRPGHDLRYAVDSSRIRALGWEPSVTLDEGLATTVEWYEQRADWWKPIKERIR